MNIGEIVRSWRRWILMYWIGVLIQIFLCGLGIGILLGILGVVLGQMLGIGWLQAGSWFLWPLWLKIVAVVAWIVIGATIVQYKRGEKE